MNNVISPLPTTADYLQYYALKTPDKVAMRWGHHASTFAQLHDHLVRCTEFLYRSLPALEAGQVVAVSTEDFYWQWVSLLALEHLGLCSVSVLPHEVDAAFVQKFSVGALITSAPAVLPVPVLSVNARALASQDSGARLQVPAQDRALHTAVRLLRTSGTTGEAKRIILDRRMWSGWTDSWDWYCHYGPESICLIQHPFSIGGVYATSTACLRAGGTVVKRDGRPFLQTLHDFGVSHATVLPIDLAALLQAPDGMPVLQQKIMLTSFGGVLPADLVAKCLDIFAHQVVDMYGTNEVAFIGAQVAGLHGRDAPGIGLWPGVQVCVVNDQDEALPTGESGHIKVRTPLMAARYEGDPASSDAMFIDGWFWPGDLGRMLPTGRLELTGRHDDLINIGGIKVNPALAEAKLRSLDYVRDAAVLMGCGPDGVQTVVIAVAFDATGRMERLQKEAAPTMAAFGHLIEWVQVESIPRTPTGKVQRSALRTKLQA